jgi:hypothetical protein
VLARRAFARTTLALTPVGGVFARHPYMGNHFAIRRRFGDDRRGALGAFAFRLRDGAAPCNQAARTTPQAAARPVLAFPGLTGGKRVVAALGRLALRLIMAEVRGYAVGRCTAALVGELGRIGIVSVVQNNL